MSSPGRRLAAGASWTYGLQLVTVVVQLGYAALTSRLVGPTEFGAYSVALSIAALVNLLGSGGLSQTAARAQEAHSAVTRPLASYALLLGVSASAFTLLTAGLWSELWAAPKAAGVVRLLAVSAVVMPILSLSIGLLRREGKFRDMAIATFFANVVGMVLGAIAVLTFKTPEALAVSAIVGQWGSFLWAASQLRGALLPGRITLHSEDVRFSSKLVAVSIFQYVSGNAPRWSVSQFVGTAVLGAWNRADVLSTVPFAQLQNALLQVIYPEFRRYQVGSSVAKSAWLDMLTLTAWLTLPLGAAIAGIGPDLVKLVLGSGWSLAAQLLPFLALLGALQPLMVLLAGALESASLFRAIWLSEVIAFLVSASGVVLVLTRHDYIFALGALISATLGRHIVHILQARRIGALDTGALAAGYLQPVAFATILYLALVLLLDHGQPLLGTLGLGALAVWVAITRREFAPVRVLRRRGIVGP